MLEETVTVEETATGPSPLPESEWCGIVTFAWIRFAHLTAMMLSIAGPARRRPESSQCPGPYTLLYDVSARNDSKGIYLHVIPLDDICPPLRILEQQKDVVEIDELGVLITPLDLRVESEASL